MHFRKGQWVKGKLPSHIANRIGDAQKAGDHFIGIYHPQSRKLEPSVTAAGGVAPMPTWSIEPESITLVRPDGSDAPMFLDGQPFQSAKLDPGLFIDLQPVVERSELPPGRELKSDFVPQA